MNSFLKIKFSLIPNQLNWRNKEEKNKSNNKQQRPRKKEGRIQRKPQPKNRQKKIPNKLSGKRKQSKSVHSQQTHNNTDTSENKKCTKT